MNPQLISGAVLGALTASIISLFWTGFTRLRRGGKSTVGQTVARSLRHVTWFAWFMIFLGASALVLVPIAATASTRPAWCSYPDPAAAAALQVAVDEHAATIARYSPRQPVDRFTLQLDLMTQCAGARV